MAHAVDVAVASDTGTERPDNQDFAHHEVINGSVVLVVVADGVSSQPGGATASRMAVETTFRAFKEQPANTELGKRLGRAVQQANIEVYDLALVVTDLRGMGTTLTAIAIAPERGELAGAHVGDSRLYGINDRALTQLTKDHTVMGGRVRLRVLSADRARKHRDYSTLTRCLGRELIVGIDRFTRRIRQGDTFVLCTDGLYNALEDSVIARIVSEENEGSTSCRTLIETANRGGTLDNVTVAVVRVVGPVPDPPRTWGGGGRAILTRLRALIRRTSRGESKGPSQGPFVSVL